MIRLAWRLSKHAYEKERALKSGDNKHRYPKKKRPKGRYNEDNTTSDVVVHKYFSTKLQCDLKIIQNITRKYLGLDGNHIQYTFKRSCRYFPNITNITSKCSIRKLGLCYVSMKLIMTSYFTSLFSERKLFLTIFKGEHGVEYYS